MLAVDYPCRDDTPLAESYLHLQALLTTVAILQLYLQAEEAVVFANQFLYYAQGFPKLRVAPDIMVVRPYAPDPVPDSYKIWEAQVIPTVIFEITSASTRSHDVNEKHRLYERLEVPEYWLFDPRGEWIPEQLRGFRLAGDTYVPITDRVSQQLNLRLSVEGALVGFYRGDTGEKLLPFTDLAARVQQLESELAQYRDRYGSLGESSPF